MNSIYQSIWNEKTGTFVAVSENTKRGGKKTSSSSTAAGTGVRFALQLMAACVLLSFGAQAWSAPVGGAVSAGSANIASGAGVTTITQSTPNVAINWQSFSIAQGEAVNFVQPSSTSVALNRVLGSDPSSILGNLTANGKVFLINPNGILFGATASVNVGGLVASTMNITDADFMTDNYKFTDAGNGTVVNEGTITAADRGYVALLGADVSNNGIIAARLGSVVLAAGKAATLDVAGDGLLSVTIDQGALNALISNGGMIQADGGQVLLTAQAAGQLLGTMVSNTGVIQAQTVVNQNGVIKLLGDMGSGTVNAGGTLDASAPTGGNGGSIEASAAKVNIAVGGNITTAAPLGQTGTFLIAPLNYNIGTAGSNIADITPGDLTTLLMKSNVTINTAAGTGADNGDININEAVTWVLGADVNNTTLTLNAVGDVNINESVSATHGNFVVCCGNDVNVQAGKTITATNGSVLLSAGNNVNLNGAVTVTDGNLMICAANDVNINVGGAITLERGANAVDESLGLPQGLTLSAGYGAGGPGLGGTVVFGAGVTATVTAPLTAITVYYNPSSYTTQTDYSLKFTGTGSAPVKQYMWVFPDGADKVFDGSTSASLTSLKGSPAGVSLVAGANSTAAFDTASEGTGKAVTFSGYTLAGTNAANFALPVSCCAPVVSKTRANIAAALPPGTTPGTTPDTTPGTTPDTTPDTTLDTTPDSTRDRTPFSTLPVATLPLVFESADMLMPAAFTFVPAESPLSQSSLAFASSDQGPAAQPAVVAAEQPAVDLVTEQPAVVPRVAPVRYVAPIHPPKQDRN